MRCLQSLTLELRSGSFEPDQADELWEALGALPRLRSLSVNLEGTYDSDDEEEFVWPEMWMFRSLPLLSRVT